MMAAHFPIRAAGCPPRRQYHPRVDIVPETREPRIDRTRARAMRAAGSTIREIADTFDASEVWIGRIVAGAAPRDYNPYARRRRFDRAEAERLESAGVPYREIGRRLGVSAAAIHQALHPRNQDGRTS